MSAHALWLLPIFIQVGLKFDQRICFRLKWPWTSCVILLRTARLVGITEVKDKDFKQGIAQNAVQCESALACNKQRVFGIVTDGEKWFFLECSLEDNKKPKFKLSKPVIVIYGDYNMEDMITKVLGHIAWLLEEAQTEDGNSMV